MAFNDIPFMTVKCEPAENEVLAGFALRAESCRNGKQAMTSVCAGLEKLWDVEGKCYTRQTGLKKIDGHPIREIGDLDAETLQCKPKHVMMNWRFVKDPRPWYVRRDNPGMARLEMQCCPVPHQRMCSKKASGCVIDGAAGFSQIPDVLCNSKKDEVLTGFSITSKNCPAGKLKVEVNCCSALQPLAEEVDSNANSTEIYDATVNAIGPGNQADGSIDAERTAPPEFSVPAREEGPLIDTMLVEEGASAMRRSSVASQEAKKAMNWPMKAHLDIPDVLCAAKLDISEDPMVNIHTALVECDAGGTTLSRTKVSGNKFIRVSATFTTAFVGMWKLRWQTHAFRGALILTKRGSGTDIAVNRDVLTPMNQLVNRGSPVQRYEAQLVAVLSPGVYTLHAVGAFDAAGELFAYKAEGDKFADQVVFIQKSHCKARAWHGFTRSNLAKCGGNDRVQQQLVDHDHSGTTVRYRNLLGTETKPPKGLYASGFFTKNPSKLMNTHFIVQGTFAFLGFSITIDISIKHGKEEEGGGIFMMFKFEWKMGAVNLGFIKAT